jgi:hypothetical protein
MEAKTMMDALIAVALMGTFVLGPLAWRAWLDRRTARALVLRAELDGAARRALGGESFLSLTVVPPTVWRRGRVVLSAPGGWGWLVERAWKSVACRLPADYDLVVRGSAPSAPAATPPLQAAA